MLSTLAQNKSTLGSWFRMAQPGRWALALIIVASALLRLSMLHKPIDYDEAYTYLFYASTSAKNVVTSFGPGANNHLFHTLCAWFSTRVFGANAATLRLPVLLAGVALPVLTYQLGRRAAGREAGILAAALVGGAHHLVTYSVNARGYGLQAALFVGALLATWQLVELPRVAGATLVGLLLALALYTVPTLILGAGSVFIWGGFRAAQHQTQRARRLLQLGLAGVITGALTLLLYSPVLPAMLKLKFHFTGSPRYGDLFSFGDRLLTYYNEGLPSIVAGAVLLAIAFGIGRDLTAHKLPLGVLWLTWPVVAVLLHRRASDSAPFPRNFIFLLPLLFILAGQGVSSFMALVLPARWRSAATALLSLLLFAATALHTQAQYRTLLADPYANARLVYEAAVVPLQAGDYLLVDGNMWERLRFYASTEGLAIGALGKRRWELIVARRGRDASHTRASNRVLVLDAKPKSRKPASEWLEHHYGGAPFSLEPRWQPGDSSAGPVTLFEATKQPGPS